MYVQSNKLMPPTSRVIRPYNCSFIATEGSNISGKLNLSGVEIPYESQFTSRIVLNPGAVNQPLLYGFLGNEVTFLMLKITYDETNPRCLIEEDQFIEYYFEDQINVTRYANKLLLLTGNSMHRVPQIYLNNPSEVKVVIEVLVANLAQSDLTLDDVSDNVVVIPNIYHNNITSNSYFDCVNLVSGSTQFEIIDMDDNVVLYLDYDEVLVIERNEDNNELVIRTTSDTYIKLQFLSLFEMYQGHSRMSWVLEDRTRRHLTKTYPSIDITPPKFIFNDGITPIEPSGNTFSYPVNRDPDTGEFLILEDDILNYFIYDIYDVVDGSISVSDATIVMKEAGHIESLSGITSTGLYDMYISVCDNANNKAAINFFILVDDIPPEITFKPGVGDIFTMIIPDDTKLPSDGITEDDIIRKTVDSVVDNVDGIIPNSDINILMGGASGLTNIYEPGEYSITYTVSDSANNYVFYDKTMIVEGDIILPSGSTFEFGTAMTSASFIYVGDEGTQAVVNIENEPFIVANSGNNFIWDLGGVNEHIFTTSGETLNVTINNNIYEIVFDGWGSLLFTINKIGDAPTFSNLSFFQRYKEVGEEGYINSDIVNINGENHLLLDDNSGSTYNIKIMDVDYNREIFDNTPVYLESFDDGTPTGTPISGTTLFTYYNEKYPLFDLLQLEEILGGNLPFAEMFTNSNDKYVINDLISSDNLVSIVMYGNYPKGTYNFRLTLADDSGYDNNITFIFVIN